MKREMLMYQKRAMNPNPLEGSVGDIARELSVGRSISVMLEPGDGTRYELLLVPMWERTVNLFAYAPEDAQAGLVVVRLAGGEVTSAGVILLNRSYHADIDRLANGNAWTKALFRWWFQLLWDEIQEAQATNKASEVSNA